MSIMQFGASEFGKTNIGGFELIETGYLGGENEDTASFDLGQHQLYILFTREINISNGNVRGFRAILIARTENDGTVQRGNLFASANSGVNVTVDSEIVTIAPSATSYDVYYALYSVM